MQNALKSYRSFLTAKINGAARVQRISLDLQAADAQAADAQAADANALAMARARAYIANNPAPRALFLVD